MIQRASLFLCTLAAAFGLATASAAQVSKGDRVRVELESGRKIEGNWVSANADSITISRQETNVPIDRSWIERLQRHEGTHRNWGKGAAIGGASGFLFGLLAVVFVGEVEDSDVPLVVVTSAVYGAAPGLLIGGLIKSDTWETVPIEDISISAHVYRDETIALVLNASF